MSLVCRFWQGCVSRGGRVYAREEARKARSADRVRILRQRALVAEYCRAQDIHEGLKVARECASPFCDKTFHDDFPNDLCPVCLANVTGWSQTLIREIGVVLGHEAEFVEYCAEHGLPNPHE